MNEQQEREHQKELARLGIEAEAFRASTFGRYMLDRIDSHIDEYITKLINCDPDDVKANRDYRNEINLGAMFKQYMDEAIQDGRNAHLQIKNQDDLSSDGQE